jgi:hypothetical protein
MLREVRNLRPGSDAATFGLNQPSCDPVRTKGDMTAEAYGHGMSVITIRHQMKGCHTWSFEGTPTAQRCA